MHGMLRCDAHYKSRADRARRRAHQAAQHHGKERVQARHTARAGAAIGISIEARAARSGEKLAAKMLSVSNTALSRAHQALESFLVHLVT